MDNSVMTPTQQSGMVVNDPKAMLDKAQEASVVLKDLVTQNRWSATINGKSYPQVEAWQAAGKFFGYTSRTAESTYVEYGEVKGFTAKAEIVDGGGRVVGAAEAACMNDEPTWKSRPLHALKSMAQTRATSKAFRQLLSWIMVMAGYMPTPAEEMDGAIDDLISRTRTVTEGEERMASPAQINLIAKFKSYGKIGDDVDETKLTMKQASEIINQAVRNQNG